MHRRAANWSVAVASLTVSVPALLALVERSGARLVHLSTHQASLEDVFVAHTGRALRDNDVTSLHSDPPPTASPAAAALPAARRDPAGEIRPTGGGRSSPLFQLTLAKVRDFAREPEALFWVFAFPLLLAVALGLASGDKPDRVPGWRSSAARAP